MAFPNTSLDYHIPETFGDGINHKGELGFPGGHSDFYHGNLNSFTLAPGSAPPLKFQEGDFYCETDDVVRGMSIPGIPMPLPGQDSFLGKLIGDSHDGDFFGGSQGLQLQLQGQGFSGKENCNAFINLNQVPPGGGVSRTSPERFQKDDVPPPQPKSQHFRLAPTTVYVQAEAPGALGNAVLDFLEWQVISSIKKVNRKKFTIKADVFLENVMCTAKIRIWKTEQECGEFAIEFQRRAGEPFTFGDMYRQSCSFLSGRFRAAMRGAPADVCERLHAPPPAPLASQSQGGQREEADLLPLLDMAAMKDLPSMQAEAAAVLVKLSTDEPAFARLLCNEDAFDHLAKLFTSNHLEVIYPSARLLSALMVYKEVQRPLSEHSLLKVVIQKIGCEGTDQIARLELMKAVSAAMRRCVALMSACAAEELKLTLKEAIQGVQAMGRSDPGMLQISAELEDAMLELSQYSG